MRARTVETLLLALACVAPPVGAVDPAAAERQYRVARRLVAEGSAEAAGALGRVVELDPGGPLADDALLDQALLEKPPEWPEELGALEAAAATRAIGLLSRIVDELPQADRIHEARYRRALVRLEALPTFDPSAARLDLLAVATAGPAGARALEARYALAWWSEQTGIRDRAADGYARLLVDAPGTAASVRAGVGAARVAAGAGRPGEGAALLQDAIDAGAPELLGAVPRRDLAVRALLAWPSEPKRDVPVASTGVRELSGIAATPAGLLVADARAGTIVHWSAAGTPLGRWIVADVQTVAADLLGRLHAAAGNQLYRLRPDGAVVAVASQGDFAPVSALAADGAGVLWVIDRRRERIGRVDPGADAPRLAWTRPEARLVGLSALAGRVTVLDARERALLGGGAAGALETVAILPVQKPVALAADEAGRVAVLDARDDAVHVFGARGEPIGRWDCKAAGILRPSALALALDGTIEILDSASGAWSRLR